MQTQETHRAGSMAIDEGLGLWRISPVQGGKQTCLIALNRLVQAGGYGVHIETCAIPALAQARGWRPVAKGIELLDSSASPIAAFRQQGVDAFGSQDGAWRMERAPMS